MTTELTIEIEKLRELERMRVESLESTSDGPLTKREFEALRDYRAALVENGDALLATAKEHARLRSQLENVLDSHKERGMDGAHLGRRARASKAADLMPATPAPAGDAEVSHASVRLTHDDNGVARFDYTSTGKHPATTGDAAMAYESVPVPEAESRLDAEIARLSAPGDAEVSHEQAWGLIGHVQNKVAWELLNRYVAQQEARQLQSEWEMAELKEKLEHTEGLLAFESKNANRHYADARSLRTERDELSRKLEAAEWEETMSLGRKDLLQQVDAVLFDAGFSLATPPSPIPERLRNLVAERDELSRKLEEAERELSELSRRVGNLRDAVAGHDMHQNWEDVLECARLVIESTQRSAEEAAQVKGDDDCPPGGHLASVYASANGDTLAFPGSLFLTVRACIDCGVLINGGPTRCLTCADKPLTSADVLAVIAEAAEMAQCRLAHDEPALAKLAEAAKEGT